MQRPFSLAAAALAVAALPTAALACGGFFCSSTPVDQEAERIIFVQEDANTVTAIVEIQYQGDPDAFAWVVPVPSKPELDVFPTLAFDALDQATQPRFQPPNSCVAMFADGAGAPGGRNAPEADEAVNVLERKVVGPFDTATIESDDPRALVEWLRLNDYRITAEMEPFIALYTRERYKFTALKLLAGKDVSAIQPLKMTYESLGPMVPLRLTAVAAELEMGVKVWILGDRRFGPAAPFADVEIPDAEIVFDPFSFQTNYVSLVARKVDEARGKGFVTEFAGDAHALRDLIRDGGIAGRGGDEAQEAMTALVTLLGSKPYITRLYTRLSPHEMDADPFFEGTAGGDVSNFHQLPEPSDGQCGGDVADPDPCDFAACGQGGRCFVAEDSVTGAARAGCACVDGAVARPMVDNTNPRAQTRVGCADVRLNFTAPNLIGTVNGAPRLQVFADPCASDPCGEDGECVSLNGSQSCRCARGFVAVSDLDADGKPFATCARPRDSVPDDFYGHTLPEPALPYPGKPLSQHGGVGSGGGCSAAGSGAPAAPIALLVLFVLPIALRRRFHA